MCISKGSASGWRPNRVCVGESLDDAAKPKVYTEPSHSPFPCQHAQNMPFPYAQVGAFSVCWQCGTVEGGLVMQRSPFTAMSPREQQERWLEFQSVRLPYCRCACEQNVCEEPTEKPAPVKPPCPEACKKPCACAGKDCDCVRGGSAKECGRKDCQCGLPKPDDCECKCREKPRCAPPQPPCECNAKPRHRQYDAVIERMNTACRNAHGYRCTSD